MRLTTRTGLISALLVTAACGSEVDITGAWTEQYSCMQTCGGSTSPITGTVQMTLAMNDDAVTRTDDSGRAWTGTRDGLVIELETTATDYQERSTLTFTEGDDGKAISFTAASTYSSSEMGQMCTGTCTGTGTRR